MPPTIGINDFVRRQTADSEFTHFSDEGPQNTATIAAASRDGWERIVALVAEHFDQAKPGYRDGVVLVPVPPEGFYTGMTILQEGDTLVGTYRARRAGEEPRKEVRAARHRQKSPCVGVDVILYRRDVLAENAEGNTDCDWEIVSVNGRITEAPAPIEPMTLIANHFQLDGGTATNMTAEEFVAALRESVVFWKDKALLAM